MAKKTLETIEKNGLLYSVHSTHIGTGDNKKRLADVHSPKPTAATMQDYIDKGVFTLDDLCSHFNGSQAIKLQSAIRLATKTGKPKTMPNDFVIGLLTQELRLEAENENPDNPTAYIQEYCQALWEESLLETL